MNLMTISNLTHWFSGLRAVTDFKLSLEKGELVAIIGPNGTGKTTIFNLITGVYRPTSGQINFEGKGLVGLPTNQIITSGIARTFQNIRLFKELSVLDNIRIAQYASVCYSPLEAIFHFTRISQRGRENSIAIDGIIANLTLRIRRIQYRKICHMANSGVWKSPVLWRLIADFLFFQMNQLPV